MTGGHPSADPNEHAEMFSQAVPLADPSPETGWGWKIHSVRHDRVHLEQPGTMTTAIIDV